MFTTAEMFSDHDVIRQAIFSLMNRINMSFNTIIYSTKTTIFNSKIAASMDLHNF